MWADLNLLALLLTSGAGCACLALALRLRQAAKQCGELQERLDEAQRLLQLREQLARSLAHEIKNPLTAITCSAKTLDLLVGGHLADEHRRSLGYIHEYGEDLLKLLSDFIEMSVSEDGRLQAHPEPVPIQAVVQSVIGLLRALAETKHIELKSSCSKGEAAYIDPKHLRQIVFNLLHNAIKYTGENGEVRIAAESDYEQGAVTITVSDNGPGIDKERHKEIFTPRSPAARRSEREEGFGLGLSVCKKLVALANGSISVESEKGAGALFSVRIPISPPAAKCAEAKEPGTDEARLAGRKVLLAAAGESIAGLTADLGAAADHAGSAAEVVAALAEADYHMLIVDNQIENGYGCELVRLLREEFSCKLPIVVVISERDEERHAIASGANACVLKPLTAHRLRAVLPVSQSL